jgi:hypothetical protein
MKRREVRLTEELTGVCVYQIANAREESQPPFPSSLGQLRKDRDVLLSLLLAMPTIPRLEYLRR